jgi:hypothetical protein
MSQTACPKCAAPLRAPPGRNKLICPACQTKFRLDQPPAQPSKPLLPLWVRVEFVSALIGVVSLGGLIALQALVLLPIGQAHPGQREVKLPGVMDGDTISGGGIQHRGYNEVLFWGSALSYGLVAAVTWYALRRWKSYRVRSDRRHGVHGSGSSAWRLWGGATAAAIVLMGGLALAVRYKDLLWAV